MQAAIARKPTNTAVAFRAQPATPTMARPSTIRASMRLSSPCRRTSIWNGPSAPSRPASMCSSKARVSKVDDYRTVIDARNRARRVVLVGENDHYKPLAVVLRQLVAEAAIGDMVFAHFTTIAKRLKTADDWRNDERMAGGDAFFEEGIHWLHIAGSLGPRIVSIDGYRPSVSTEGPDKRAKSMMVAFRYDNNAVGSLYYSREIPSLFKGLRLSKCADAKASSPSNRTACSCSRAATACRDWSSPAFATFVATRRCIAIFTPPLPTAAHPR